MAEIEIDLTTLADKEITLELVNQPTDWAWEHGYWGQTIVETIFPDIATPPQD